MSKARILSLLDVQKQKQASKIVASVKFEKTLLILSEYFAQENGENSVILLRAVFLGLKEDNPKKNDIIKKVFTLINSNEIETKVTNDLIGFIASELENLPIKELTELISFFLESIDKGEIKISKSLELMAKILSITSNLPKVCHEDSVMNGEEYHKMIIDEICRKKWAEESILPLVTGLRDVDLKEGSLKQVVDKVLSDDVFKAISLQEVPSLIYQVLLLSVKGCKQEVLDGIITFFFKKSENNSTEAMAHSFLEEENDDINKEELRSVEGTSLLHVMFAVKQDQALGREFVKYLKLNAQDNPAKVFSPFTVALALSMTQIHRLEEQLFDFLKSIVLRHFKDEENRRHSKWINEMFPERFPFEKNILLTAKNSKSGWDYVTHGLVNLGFNLIDSYTPKQNDIFSLTSDAVTPNQKACQLGAKVIQEVFQSQDTYRGAILQQILDLIITKSSINQQHYLDLLSALVSRVPQIVIDCLPKFREVFDYIPMLKVQTAEGLLRAVLPLMRVSMSIKDSLILVLRKSMFSKNLESRKIAVMGFLLVLKHFKIESDNSFSLSSQASSSQLFSCSQLDISSQGRYPSAANEALCLELIGGLRKSLTQHGSVRQLIYESIYEVICKNPKLSQAALDLLFLQFTKYYRKEQDEIPPITLDNCVITRNNEVILSEPLDHLLCALQLCTKKSGKRLDEVLEEDEGLSFLLDNIEEAIESLTKRMLKAGLEDFSLDKTVDFQSSSDEGMKNNMLANIALGIYEVLMEYTYMKEKEITVGTCETVQNLFDKLQELQETLSESQAGGKKGKSSQSKVTRSSILSFKCLTRILSDVLCDNQVENEAALNILRQSSSFAKYLTTAVVSKLQQLISRRECDGAGGKNMEHLFRQCLVLSRVFLQQVNGEGMLSVEVLRKNKGKRLGNICLEGLSCIVGFVCNHLPDDIKQLLESLDFHPDVISQNVTSQGSIIYRVIRRIQRLTIKVITSPDDDLGPKEAQVLISMLSHLYPHLKDETEVGHVYTWFMRLCVEQNTDDPLLMKTIFSKFLSLHHQCKGTLSMISKICQDIHSRIGDIDEDIEVEESLNFKMITEKNAAPTVFVLVSQHIERILDEIDLVLSKIKNGTSKTDEQNKEKQNRISQSLIGIILSIHELIQSAFTPGQCSDIITKVSTKVYNILGSLTKYYMGAYIQKKSNIDQKFERLVKLTGTHLAQQVYAMISYMQSTQTNEQQSMNATTKQKEKKKVNKAGKSRAMKESRCIPNLIYSIEQYERYLIQLSKKTKIDFMGNIKRSTARDFRINAASLEAALHELESEEEEAAGEVSVVAGPSAVNNTAASRPEVLDLTTDDRNEQRPAPKRAKLSGLRKPLKSLNTK